MGTTIVLPKERLEERSLTYGVIPYIYLIILNFPNFIKLLNSLYFSLNKKKKSHIIFHVDFLNFYF